MLCQHHRASKCRLGRCFVSFQSRKKIFSFFSLLVLSGSLLWAEVTGGILGTVVDQSGAAIPNATLTLTNPNTGLSREARTDSSGNFEFLSVPIGENYSLEVQMSGFQKSTQTGIKLLVRSEERR